jgi:cation:H+ antiporter
LHDLFPFLPEHLPIWANGLVVLVTIGVIGKGAAWLVEAAARIAQRIGVSELVIGLTVVSLGTSAPEFAVTLLSAFRGHGDISVGNIVGSNIFNLGFILGGCALIRAIPTSKTLVLRDGMVLIGTTLLLLALLGFDLRLDRYDGAILSAGLILYLFYLFKHRKDLPGSEEDRN